MSKVTPCFTPGTRLATDRGWRPVEDLRRGDRLVTRDNGLKRIAWSGRRDVGYADLAEVPELRPVLVRRGAFGHGTPERDMLVSPNHRFLVLPDGRDGEEYLCPAAALTYLDGVQMAPALGVSYLHVLLNAHEVILADGVWTESFHPDDMTLHAMERQTRREILALFPEIETLGAVRRFPPARDIRQSRFER
ncbi:MAG: Hint domain-containing protein [Pseudomonadota bacterium]